MNTKNSKSASSPGEGGSQNFSGGGSSPGEDIRGRAEDMVDQAKDAGSGLTSAARDATSELKRSAALLARDGSEKLTDALSSQLSNGASYVEDAVDSLRAAAAELDRSLPPLAYALRAAASRGDDIAEQVRTKSLGELLEAGSTYARRNPLVVFGAAAGAGLLLSRFAKSSGNAPASSGSARSASSSGGSRGGNRSASGQSTRGTQPANL